MSLINEALKKAQRQRTDVPDHPAGAATGPASVSSATETSPEGSRHSGNSPRAGSRSGAPVVLLGAGAAVIIVLSVVATVFLLNRPASTPAPAAATSRPAATAAVVSAPPPVIIAPEIKAPVISRPEPIAATVETTSPTSVSSATPSAAVPAPSPVDVAAAANAAASTVTTAPAPAAAPSDGKPDPRVSAFVDAIRVAGVRSSGNESRVLMNDKVYRVNDLVDRMLALRLTKVETNALTFTDVNGIVYVKSF